MCGDARPAFELAELPACTSGAFAREALEARMHLAAVVLIVGVAELDDVVRLGVTAAVDGSRRGAHFGCL